MELIMTGSKNYSGKVTNVLLIVLIFLIIAFAGGYYVSLLKFNQRSNQLDEKFIEFESRYEQIISTLHSSQMEIKAYIEEKEGKTQEETKQLRLQSILLKAKGEVISSKIALSRNEIQTSLEQLDVSIVVLRDAFELATGDVKEKIEDLRLRLATVKGIIEVNAQKAQQELDKLWREIDTLIGT